MQEGMQEGVRRPDVVVVRGAWGAETVRTLRCAVARAPATPLKHGLRVLSVQLSTELLFSPRVQAVACVL